jgi:hypothetical protein
MGETGGCKPRSFLRVSQAEKRWRVRGIAASPAGMSGALRRSAVLMAAVLVQGGTTGGQAVAPAGGRGEIAAPTAGVPAECRGSAVLMAAVLVAGQLTGGQAAEPAGGHGATAGEQRAPVGG